MKVATVKERIEFGKSRRAAVSFEAQAQLLIKERAFDPIKALRGSEAGRVEKLLPIKYLRMSAGPFAFFRGSVAIMAADLGRLPHSGLNVQLCGDAHLENLGSFATPDGRVVFDFTDFDETIHGPWEWDVKRMATSIILAGRESKHERKTCNGAAEAFVAQYCRSILKFSQQPILDVARHQVKLVKRSQPVRVALRESARMHPDDLLRKFTKQDGAGIPRFRNKKPNFWRVKGSKAAAVLNSLNSYRKHLAPERQHLFDLFKSIDVGFKVVGTGSVGLRDYVLLFRGNRADDAMFLQVKQEMPSAYAPYLPVEADRHHGRRVALGQRAVQPSSDLLLGWTKIGRHDFLVRQLNDHKGEIDLENLAPGGLLGLGLVAGELLARAHARSGDACEISGYCGTGTGIVKALAEFARQYGDQTEADFGAFQEAIALKKIEVAKVKAKSGGPKAARKT